MCILNEVSTQIYRQQLAIRDSEGDWMELKILFNHRNNKNFEEFIWFGGCRLLLEVSVSI